MSLLEFEKTLLTLYTDERVLNRFLQEGSAAFSGRGLSDHELRAIASIDKNRVQAFSKQLQNKRLLVTRFALNKGLVFLFPAHRAGPVLFFNGGGIEQELPLPDTLLPIFSEIAKKRYQLSFASVVMAARSVLNEIRKGKNLEREPVVGDILKAWRLVRRYQLEGKTLRRVL